MGARMRWSPFVIRALIALGLAAASLPVAAQTEGETAVLSSLRNEGLNGSRVMETLSWLADVFGPRLTGSPSFAAAGDWTVKSLQEWRLTNIRREHWPLGEGWTLRKAEIRMTLPQVMPIIGLPLAWTPGTNGPVEADVIHAVIADAGDFARWSGKLRGKIVLIQPPRRVELIDRAVSHRYDEEGLRQVEQTPVGPQWIADEGRYASAAGRQPGLRGPSSTPEDQAEFESRLIEFLKREGVVAVIDRGDDRSVVRIGSSENIEGTAQRVDGGTVFVNMSRPGLGNRDRLLPWVSISVEQYNRMTRLLAKNIPVRVAMEIDVAWLEEPSEGGGFNIFADIPGSDLKHEVVMIGAHLDGYHGATAAVDNGAGSAAMLEAMRLLMRVGVKPRRTIRLALWGGEELGLLGSSAFVRSQLVGATGRTRSGERIALYLNMDNGSGRIRGIWLQNNLAFEPFFEEWLKPVSDLGATTVARRGTIGYYSGEIIRSGTDHLALDAAGVPAFQFIQDRLSYFNRSSHSNMDYLDHASEPDLIQAAVVIAATAYQAAMADRLPPPRPTPPRAGRGK